MHPKYKHSELDSHVDNASLHRLKDNILATSLPTSSDDSTQGYAVGSRWMHNYVCVDATPGGAVWKVSGGVAERWVIRDEKAMASNGGTFTGGAWTKRDLNTIALAFDSSVTLSDSIFTLTKAGNYLIYAQAPAYKVRSHKIRLTDGDSVFVYGSNAYCNDDVQTESQLFYQVIVGDVPKSFFIEHICDTTSSTIGFGLSNGFGGSEIYTTVVIDKCT